MTKHRNLAADILKIKHGENQIAMYENLLTYDDIKDWEREHYQKSIAYWQGQIASIEAYLDGQYNLDWRSQRVK